MYRLNLAAYWVGQPGEFKPDECIEDIFAGGDGWGDNDDLSSGNGNTRRERRSARKIAKAGDMDGRHRSRSRDSYAQMEYSRPRAQDGGVDKRMFAGMSGRASLEQHAHILQAEAERSRTVTTNEVDEFDIREDLRCWNINHHDGQ